jgi:hypothetical protein
VPCSLVKFTGISEVLAASIIIINLMMEAASTSEISVNFYQTTQSNMLLFQSKNCYSLVRPKCHISSDLKAAADKNVVKHLMQLRK